MLESLLDKIAGLQACNFIKKILQERCFPVNFARILRTAFLQNTSGRIFWLFYILKKNKIDTNECRFSHIAKSAPRNQFNVKRIQQKVLIQPQMNRQKQPSELFLKESFENSTARKTTVLESLFHKVAGLQVCNFIMKRPRHKCFPV